MLDQWRVRTLKNRAVRLKSPDGEEFIIWPDDSLNVFRNATMKSIADRTQMSIEEVQKVIMRFRNIAIEE